MILKRIMWIIYAIPSCWGWLGCCKISFWEIPCARDFREHNLRSGKLMNRLKQERKSSARELLLFMAVAVACSSMTPKVLQVLATATWPHNCQSQGASATICPDFPQCRSSETSRGPARPCSPYTPDSSHLLPSTGHSEQGPVSPGWHQPEGK